MAKGKAMRPALSPEARENQMISYAIDLAEKQLIDGSASSQVITHFLRLGTTKAQLEKEKIEKENKLLDVRAKSIESEERRNEIYEKALEAFRSYSGNGDSNDY